MDKKKMKEEAARRMKALELYDFPARSIIRAFLNDNAVFVSLPAKGNRVAELHPLTDAEKKMVKNFEEEHDAIAYHVIRNEFETGITYSTIYSILYVSDKEKEWKTECNGFKDFSSHTLHTQWSILGMLAGQKEILTTFQQELAASVPLQLLLAVVGYADKDNRILRQKEEDIYNTKPLPFLFFNKYGHNSACKHIYM